MSIIQLFKPNSRVLYCKNLTSSNSLNAEEINATEDINTNVLNANAINTNVLNVSTFTIGTLNVSNVNATAIDTGTIVSNEYNSRYGNYIKNSYLIWQKLWAPLQFINMQLNTYEKINIFAPPEVSPAYTGSNILNCAMGNQYEIDISYLLTVANPNSSCSLFFRMSQGQGGSYFTATMGLTSDFTTVVSPCQSIIKVIFTIESYNPNTGECKINYSYSQTGKNTTNAPLPNYTLHQTITYVADISRLNGVLPLDFGIIMPSTTGSTPLISATITNTKVIQTC